MRRGLAVVVFFCCTLTAMARVHADEDSDAMARHHFEAGRTYFERARYLDAHREFSEAYRLSGRPTLLLNMSRAREAAGDPAGAAEELGQWLAQAPADDSNRVDTENRLARLNAQVADEQQRAATRPAPSQAGARDQPAGTGPNRRLRRTVYGLWAAGGGALVAGSVLLALGHSDIQAVESPDSGTSWTSVEDEYERGPRRVGVGIGLLSVGVLSLAAGTVLFFMARKQDREPRGTGMWHPSAPLTGRF